MPRPNPISDRRLIVIAELMASVALLSACGGGGADPTADASAADATADAAAAVVADGTVQILARRPRSSTPTIGTATSLPSGYVQCAGEWVDTSCGYSGSTVLYYGVEGSFRYATLSGPFDCNTANAVLGDPAPGVTKACYIPSAVAPAPAPAPACTVNCTPGRMATRRSFPASACATRSASSFTLPTSTRYPCNRSWPPNWRACPA